MKGGERMATAYEAAFKYEILNEVIASVHGLIRREFPKKLPSDIAPLNDEVWDIYHKIPLEDDIKALEKYDERLLEIRDYVQNRVNKSTKIRKRMVG